MKSAREQLMDLIAEPGKCYSVATSELVPLQLEAARALFAERREQIQVLDRRARDTGTDAIDAVEDLIPLLFPHTTYKSYPQAFLKNRRWDRMNTWLGTISTYPTTNVDVEGVNDIDDWIARLYDAGHLVSTTSGTGGKSSILNRTAGDHAFFSKCLSESFGWPNPIPHERSRHFFFFGPRSGPYTAMIANEILVDLYARPDSRHYLSNEPLRLGYLTELAEMRQRMADGSATPADISAMDERSADQAARTSAQLTSMVDSIASLHREPLFLSGPWAQLWGVMQSLRAQGIGEGDFHPDTILAAGGGTKGADLPEDFRDQLLEYFGDPRGQHVYGMAELSQNFPECEAGNFHQVPWVIPFVLDDLGEAQIGDRKGVVDGRFGFVDLATEGRWNALITGDRVSIDFREQCPCGRSGLVILPTISRYVGPGEDDKIGCAGTIDAYVKGEITE